MNRNALHDKKLQASLPFLENVMLQQAKKIKSVSNQAQTEILNTSQPLKGFLMDKGGAGLERQLAKLENAVHLLQVKMVAVKDRHLAVNREYKCSYLRLVLTKDDRQFGESKRRLMADRMSPLINEIDVEDVNGALKRNYQLTWRANPVLAVRLDNQIKGGSRVHPFAPTHPHHAIVMDVLRQDAPHYLEACAGFEAVRVSLNTAMKAYKLLAQELALHDLERQFTRIPELNKYTLREAEEMVQVLDPGGQLQKILGALFSVDH